MRGLVPGGWEADQGLSFNTSSVEALAKTKDSLVRLCLLAGLEILSVSPPPDWAGGGGGGEGSLSNLLKIFPVYLQCIIWNRNAVGDSLSCVFFFQIICCWKYETLGVFSGFSHLSLTNRSEQLMWTLSWCFQNSEYFLNVFIVMFQGL